MAGKANRKIDWIRAGITVILLLFMLAVYPGYLARDEYLSSTNSVQYMTTDELGEAAVVEQFFQPLHTYLNSIQLAIEFDEQAAGDACLSFLLWEEDQKVLASCEIPLKEISSQCYFDVEINKMLRQDKVYHWSLVLPEGTDLGCSLMYTEIIELQAPENQGFLVNGEAYGAEGAQTISQYRYYVHADKAVILGNYWCCAILLYWVAMECINRLLKSAGARE